jgi:hypothetical protein
MRRPGNMEKPESVHEEQPLEEPLEGPPTVPDGDDQEAGGGRPASPVEEDELEDAPDHDEDEEDVDSDDAGTA